MVGSTQGIWELCTRMDESSSKIDLKVSRVLTWILYLLSTIVGMHILCGRYNNIRGREYLQHWSGNHHDDPPGHIWGGGGRHVGRQVGRSAMRVRHFAQVRKGDKASPYSCIHTCIHPHIYRPSCGSAPSELTEATLIQWCRTKMVCHFLLLLIVCCYVTAHHHLYTGGFSESEENYILRSTQDLYGQSPKGWVEEVDLMSACMKDKIFIYLFIHSFIYRRTRK